MNLSRILFPLAACLVGLGLACDPGTSNNPGAESPTNRLKVVTTVAPITSIVENIGGSQIDLEGIVPEGVNSHTFEPAPSVAARLEEADLIVLNGLFLEEPTLEMARSNKGAEAIILALGDGTISMEEWRFDFSFPESGGQPNPHLWPDPRLAGKYAELVHGALTVADPVNAGYYDTNLQEFLSRIEALDQGISASVATVPAGSRKLLTYHDSWAYFALRYGMEVVGAAQPADFSEPSAREVVDLIKQIEEQKIPAIFGSEVFPSDVLETIAAESGAIYVDELRDDDLPGGPGDARHSYLGLMLQNMEIMIPALGGNVDALKDFDPGPVFPGESRAIYPQ